MFSDSVVKVWNLPPKQFFVIRLKTKNKQGGVKNVIVKSELKIK